MMKKHLAIKISLIALIALTLTSCVEINIGGRQTPIKFLESNYAGSFTFRGIKAPPAFLSDRYLGTEDIYCFFSTNLGKEIHVNTSGSDYFESNYLYVKYQKVFENYAFEEISPFFEDAQVLFSPDWYFTNENEFQTKAQEFLNGNITYKTFYILVNATAEEMPSIEERIKASSFQLRNKDLQGKLYFFVNDASLDSDRIDFTSVTEEKLYTDSDLISKFEKRYFQETYSKKLIEVTE